MKFLDNKADADIKRSLAGHAGHASRAGRASCSGSAGYVTRAVCVVSAITDNC